MTMRMVGALLLVLTACSGRPIEIHDAVVVDPIGDVAAAYLSIENRGETTDRLVGVSSPAGKAELHRSFEEGGLMQMQPIDTIEVGPDEIVTLAPGGLHIMLFGVAGLDSQDSVQLVLEFETAGVVEVTAPLRSYADLLP